jgi:hypothetical protein
MESFGLNAVVLPEDPMDSAVTRPDEEDNAIT